MPWQTLHVPMHPRTRRTADGTFYTHDGTGQMRVREHHVAELASQGGVLPPGSRMPRRRGIGTVPPPAPLVRPLSPPATPEPPVAPPVPPARIEGSSENTIESPVEPMSPPARRSRGAP